MIDNDQNPLDQPLMPADDGIQPNIDRQERQDGTRRPVADFHAQVIQPSEQAFMDCMDLTDVNCPANNEAEEEDWLADDVLNASFFIDCFFCLACCPIKTVNFFCASAVYISHCPENMKAYSMSRVLDLAAAHNDNAGQGPEEQNMHGPRNYR